MEESSQHRSSGAIMSAANISALAAQWRSDARIYQESVHDMRREAARKRLYGYNSDAQSQEELADRCAAYGRALADCAAQLERIGR